MNLLGNSNQSISLVQDPFKSDKVVYINMEYFTSSNKWEGKIRFRNGMTDGAQNFEVTGAENLPVLLKQMQDFVNSLK